MAVVFPDHLSANGSEKYVYEYCKNNLPSDWIGYFRYFIGCREFDSALFIPGFGVIILEIKNWKEEFLQEVKDNNCIIYRNMALNSPMMQANNYRFKLINRINDSLNLNIAVLPIVCYPSLSKDFYIEKRLDIISPNQWTILKDDFANPEAFIQKLTQAFQYVTIPTDDFSDENVWQ